VGNIKAKLRKNMKYVRDNLPGSYRKLASSSIAGEFAEKWSSFDRYALYSPIGSEVDVASLETLLAGKEILYPKVTGDGLLWGKGALAPGYGGIKEPSFITDFIPQIVVVPCLAFDRDNYRLGYGKGYYDRFLHRFPEVFSVAVAFAYQEVDTIFPDENDMRVDAVLTDKKLLAVEREA
jgi:5-formyltetrahydrofolate cyclo-ligase